MIVRSHMSLVYLLMSTFELKQVCAASPPLVPTIFITIVPQHRIENAISTWLTSTMLRTGYRAYYGLTWNEQRQRSDQDALATRERSSILCFANEDCVIHQRSELPALHRDTSNAQAQKNPAYAFGRPVHRLFTLYDRPCFPQWRRRRSRLRHRQMCRSVRRSGPGRTYEICCPRSRKSRYGPCVGDVNGRGVPKDTSRRR